jgi:hypothetical protein
MRVKLACPGIAIVTAIAIKLNNDKLLRIKL